MKRLVRNWGIILVLASLWAIGGFFIGLALEIIGFDTYPLRITIASYNVIVGMLLFLLIISDPLADRAFFEIGLSIRPGYPIVGCLWVMPIMLLVVGVSMWFWAVILNLIFPK